MSFWQHLKKIDWLLWAITALIVVLGMVSFSGISSKSHEFVERQIFFLIAGVAVMIATSFFDYRIFKNFTAASMAIYILTVLLLFVALGSREIRGVSSWVIIGGVTFAPSEFAKLGILILLAKYFSQKHVEIYRTPHILASGAYVLLPAILTLKQPDLGSTLVFLAIWLGILLFAGIKRKHMLTIIMAGVVVASMAWAFALKPYQKNRITSFIDPYLDPRGTSYNLLQAQTAIGSGRLFGEIFGPAESQSPTLVPEPYNDFAFAVFAKKFGFIGIAGLFALIILLAIKISRIAYRTNNNFAKLFSLGFLTLIFTHIFINAGMNLGLMPITGIPFSFLSYGGSHLITLMIGLGIIQNIRINSRA
ncbi:MAG: rod shape-determining protein RodA [Candidatus Yanofskybacteria bacterium]|nr:rod shape-determining protein RodA [Candidatus Yanofskybacteria bacterium]